MADMRNRRRTSGTRRRAIASRRRLHRKALGLFDGDAKAAKTWLNSPNMALSWRAPLKLAEREKGARLVEDLIGRLEHGVYS